MTQRKVYELNCGRHRLSLGDRTCIMGVVNVTPDSFSDGGKFYGKDAAVAHGKALAAEGAHILDIGGESTRPFSEAVTEEEEMKRVVPVIEALAKCIDIPISIDTTKPGVAKAALDAGAEIINDIGALRDGTQMARLAADSGAPVILMHMKGKPKNMQVSPEYDDLLGEIRRFLGEAIDRAVANGIDRSQIVVDPGIGFGKTLTHNLSLLGRLDRFKALDVPILVGSSRKSFLQRLTARALGKDALRGDSPEVETATQASVSAAVLNGAHIVRVHEVKNTVITATILDAVLEADSNRHGRI